MGFFKEYMEKLNEGSVPRNISSTVSPYVIKDMNSYLQKNFDFTLSDSSIISELRPRELNKYCTRVEGHFDDSIDLVIMVFSKDFGRNPEVAAVCDRIKGNIDAFYDDGKKCTCQPIVKNGRDFSGFFNKMTRNAMFAYHVED